MRVRALFVSLIAAAALAAVIDGCGASGPAPLGPGQGPPPATATPAASLLYVDHNGTLYSYHLPLTQTSKPIRTLREWPGLATAPVIAVDQYGNIALASTQFIRFFKKPIVSFAASRVDLALKLTPAITEIGDSGADLVDIEYDPNENLWLLNNLGAGITELRSPITKSSVAALSLAFGVPGTKTAGYTTLVQARFDVDSALYVYARAATRSRLFKVSFPYARPPGTLGINLAQALFVDASEWPPTAQSAPTLLVGQYYGALQSPKPGSPPSPPVNVEAQFAQPFNPLQGRFPQSHIDTIAGALAADPYRFSLYALDAGDGSLNVYDLPMKSKERPKLSLSCLGGPSNCSEKPEHVFLAP